MHYASVLNARVNVFVLLNIRTLACSYKVREELFRKLSSGLL